MIKLELIRTFLAVSEFGNIAEASAKLGRTQSAVSMALKHLEGLLGGNLFENDRKNKKTPLGEYIERVGRAEVSRYERAVRSMRAFARNEIGRIDIACVPSVAITLLPQVIKAFITKYPAVELDVRDTDSVAVETAVERGACEIGIAGAPSERSALEFQPIFSDPFVLVVPKGHPLLKLRRPIRAGDLFEYPFIANGAAHSVISDGFGDLIEQSKLMVHSVTSLLALIRSGTGVTILPALSVSGSPEGLEIIHLEKKVPQRVVGFLSLGSRAMTPAAASFRDFFITALRSRKLRSAKEIRLLI